MRILNNFILILSICLCLPVYAAEGLSYDAHGKRDPFWPLVNPSGVIINYETEYAITDLSLEGIVAGAQGSIAIINGKIVKQNDAVGQYTVTKIGSQDVELKKGDQTYHLKLKKGE